VLVYETGADTWQRYDAWPRACAKGCASASRKLYLQPGGKLAFEPPPPGPAAFDEYISDPAKPVPYRARPTLAIGAEGSTWGEWLVDDQRHAASRPDVMVYETEPLKEPLRIAGQPWADLVASTSGTDTDWVVKLIDVWPAEFPNNAKLGGYQQMLSADIFRGRFREDISTAKPLKAGEPLAYRIRLPQAHHTFLPGHRVMVQVQSSWFPLYDRNPQTFVPNIMFAKPADYAKATQRIWHTPSQASAIELPVIAVSP
jgi:putative CocE/NonD family hydrolase